MHDVVDFAKLHDGHFMRKPVVVRIHQGIAVVRDDLLPGGSKVRFLPYLMGDKSKEVVYASPFCGGAQIALALAGKHRQQRVTIFSAARKVENLHPRQIASIDAGAHFEWVSNGYFTNVSAQARYYAEADEANRYLLPVGFHSPEAVEAFGRVIATVSKMMSVRMPEQVWCVSSSGMLATSLCKGFPNSEVHAVKVGLRSKDDGVFKPANLVVHDFGDVLGTPCRVAAPFPCCPNYDRKAWVRCVEMRKGRTLFWNVMG